MKQTQGKTRIFLTGDRGTDKSRTVRRMTETEDTDKIHKDAERRDTGG